jgi:hypothetical protein
MKELATDKHGKQKYSVFSVSSVAEKKEDSNAII